VLQTLPCLRRRAIGTVTWALATKIELRLAGNMQHGGAKA
jgi:hypothetical protein